MCKTAAPESQKYLGKTPVVFIANTATFISEKL